MYRPTAANQMTTAMQLQIPKNTTVYGVAKKTYTDGDIDALRTVFCSSESIQIADSSQETSCQANVAEHCIP